MIIKSDWHIHTEKSYDASLSLDTIIEKSNEFGIEKIGITDHANFNDTKFLTDLRNSAEYVKKYQTVNSKIILGVELTPIEKPEFLYIEKNKTREGYIPPVTDKPYEIELAQTKEQLMELGVSYAIGASHWRVDCPYAKTLKSDVDTVIREWYRQQMWLACDERVTILGHPWYHGKGIWYDDFSVIPHSMNLDIGYALKENNKYVECNSGVILSDKTSEKFRKQYAEFLRELFEMGVKITYGSDSHNTYLVKLYEMEKLLKEAGFKEGDFSDSITLWN